jgi:hypothetical protein
MQTSTIDEQIIYKHDKHIRSTPNARTRNSSNICQREDKITYCVVRAVAAATT